MIKPTVKKHNLDGFDEAKQNLEYWLSRSPEERLSAVEHLRKQAYGDLPRLQRVVRVLKRGED